MFKICLIENELKDENFANGGEKVDFFILKALCESDFQVDVFCAKNNLKKKYKIHNITELAEENFVQNALTIANNLNYDLTFSTDYIPTDAVYLHKHTEAYKEGIVKSKLDALCSAIFSHKNYVHSQKEIEAQDNFAKNYKIILTPSSILKSDLINLLQVEGQKVYILPPALDAQKEIFIKNNKIFTFGFIGNDFLYKGGFVLLKSLGKLNNFDFKVKIIYPYEKLNFFVKFYIKALKLEDKVEFLPYQEDMNDFYNSIDCLLLPSKGETFGMSVLEAMSRGKIVIISSRCGAKDIIEQEYNGFIFDITNHPARNLARIMKYVLTNKEDFESLRQKAVYTSSVYNFEKFKTELVRILNKFCENAEEQ